MRLSVVLLRCNVQSVTASAPLAYDAKRSADASSSGAQLRTPAARRSSLVARSAASNATPSRSPQPVFLLLVVVVVVAP